jgi:glycosyltransferase involved in cell wall biosynthesis
MKILLISAFFPPYNAIGSVRSGKLAKYLLEQGHDIRVVAAKLDNLPATAPLEIPNENVAWTKWVDVNRLPTGMVGDRMDAYRKGESDLGAALSWAGKLFRMFMHLPDAHIGWYPYAMAEVQRLTRDWRPDLIYASAQPYTSLLLAAVASKRMGIPWVAEFRDLWVDNPYYPFPVWRRVVDRWMEKHVVRTAALLVTVSEPLAESLRERYSKPVEVVLNGFDPSDFPDPPPPPRSKATFDIVYTGMLYPGRRDPTPLFEALRELGTEAEDIRVLFFGRLLPGLKSLVEHYGVGNTVQVHKSVSYQKSLRLQVDADALLLLLWNSPEERGVFTGKLFEYLGARRPILSIGLDDGVAANLIRERDAGAVCCTSVQVAEQLRAWLRTWRVQGRLPSLSSDVNRGLSRHEQFRKLEPFLVSAAKTLRVPQRVIVVTRKLDVGGTERHLLQVLPRLDRRRFDVHVTVLRPYGRLEELLRKAGIPVTRPPFALSGWLGLAGSAVALLVRMAMQRRTIFHFFLPEAYAVGGLCGMLTRHSNLVMSRRSLNRYQSGHPYVAHLERILHGTMRCVLGNSRAVLKELAEERVPSDRLALIYNGIDATRFQVTRPAGEIRAELGVDKDALVLTTVANLIPYKGHADLLSALTIATANLPRPWHLLCVGRDDGILGSLRMQAEQGAIAGHIVFLGERRDVADLLNASDIGLLCSHEEGFSNSILEGMAASLPMIVTAVGGNAEAVVDGENGLVVPPHDPMALTHAILMLAAAPEERRRMGESGRRRVERMFSLDACVKAYENIYSAVGGCVGDDVRRG